MSDKLKWDKRDNLGRFLPSDQPQPNELWYSTRDVRMRRATILAFQKLDAEGWTSALRPEHRAMVEERVQELTGGKYAELSPALRSLVLGICRDEVLELSIESEVYGSKSRRLTNAKTGKIAAWIPELVKLRESLDKRREKLEKALGELESQQPVSLAQYLEAREKAHESAPKDEPKAEPPGNAKNALRTLSKSVPADSESERGTCETCGGELPPRQRRGSVRRHCSAKCRKAGWLSRNEGATRG